MRTRKRGPLEIGNMHNESVPLYAVSASSSAPFVRHKFRAQATEVDGIRFSSKRESRYYCELLLARQSGSLLFFLRQVPFHLPGGVRYVCDFVEFWSSGEVRFVDVKGFKTPMYTAKRKIVEAQYPIKITEV